MNNIKDYIPTLDEEFYTKPINLDITNRCPLQCPACLRQKPMYKRTNYKEMTTSEIKKIAKTFEYIEFCGQQSDPLVHPNILEFIFICQVGKLDIHTATSHKKKNFYKEAFDTSGEKTSWIFGLDGLPEESHIYRINQDGIHLYEMMKLGAKMGINIIWQYIVFNYNQDHIEQAKQMAKDDGIEFKICLSSRWDYPGPWRTKMGLIKPINKLKPREEYCVNPAPEAHIRESDSDGDKYV